MKKIKFFIKNLTRILIFNFMLRYVIYPKRNYFIFGMKDFKGQNLFLHNSKYVFLYLHQFKNIHCTWLTDDDEVIKKFKAKGFNNVYKRYSFKGIYYALNSKYWIHDFSNITDCISNLLPHKSILINLWHGIPLKNIEKDVPNNIYNKLNKVGKFIFDLINIKDNYYVTNCQYELDCYKTAFQTTEDKIKILGSPRLDVLYHEVENSDLFMEEDYNNLKSFKELGKKLLYYVPTYRDSGMNLTSWISSEKTQQFLKDNNAIIVCKLHYIDANSIDTKSNFVYKMKGNSDIYPVLKYSDAIITDYSSIYFDYLLLDKPIIYYPIDLKEYLQKTGLYKSYEELTAGIKAYNEDELISAMLDVINGIDSYKEQRKKLRDEMFKYQDGKNSERVVEWIKSLG